MAIPAAPQEANGAKVLFLVWDNSGTNAAALMRALSPGTQNGTSVAHLAVATHLNGETFDSTDPLAVLGGVDGTTVRRVIVDASGRVISRPGLVYNATGVNAFAHQRTLAQGTLNSEAVGHAAVASHIDGETFDASDPVVVLAGVAANAAKRLSADATGRLLVSGDLVVGSRGHKNIAVTGTAVAIGTSSACRMLKVKADPGNAALLYVGTSGVTANEVEATGGYQLAAGDSVDVPCSNRDTVFINGTASDGCSYLLFT